MKVEIISIGDELLIGQVINTNATWIAEQLNLSGFDIVKITSISDDSEEIIQAIDAARVKVDVVIMTGGLGPTKDDITKKTLAGYFNSRVVQDEKAYALIQSFFEKRGFELTEINRKQSEVLEICTPIYNKNGTASGMWIEESDVVVISMPGVPFEMKAMLENDVIPMLKKKFETQTIVHRTVLTAGVGESFLSEIIQDWEEGLPEFMKLAYLPSPGVVRLRITANGNDRTAIETAIERKVKELECIIPDKIFGYEKDTLERVVGELLKTRGKTLATAESCTGGYIGHLITSIDGSSQYFKGSIISYSNEAKVNLLNVKEPLVEDVGAVSEEVVLQMAKGAREKLNTDYAVATSGIAGPSGGADEKPVGTTWIAVASENKAFAKMFIFGGNRERNIRMTAISALNMLRKNILGDE